MSAVGETTPVTAAAPATRPELRTPSADVVLGRLEDQLGWFEFKSARNRRLYQSLKLVQLVVAAAIPVLAVAITSRVVPATLGALIVVLEGLQQLFQFQQNWVNYRNTAEALKHEKYLYLAEAGAYRPDTGRRQHLAETVEALVSADTGKWTVAQSMSAAPQPPPKAAIASGASAPVPSGSASEPLEPARING